MFKFQFGSNDDSHDKINLTGTEFEKVVFILIQQAHLVPPPCHCSAPVPATQVTAHRYPYRRIHPSVSNQPTTLNDDSSETSCETFFHSFDFGKEEEEYCMYTRFF